MRPTFSPLRKCTAAATGALSYPRMLCTLLLLLKQSFILNLKIIHGLMLLSKWWHLLQRTLQPAEDTDPEYTASGTLWSGSPGSVSVTTAGFTSGLSCY